MFGRLLKYDFRSMLKQFAFIWPAALALAVVNHFTMDAMTTGGGDGILGTGAAGTTAGIAMLVYVAILMAMFIAALIFVIQRFYKGLLGDEGYLMHTLPVRPWQLIGSKLLVAVVTTFLSIVVAVLSILMIFPWELSDLLGITQFLRFLFQHWNNGVDQAALYAAKGVLLLLFGLAMSYLQLYLSMAIGHLFSKHRIALSVAAFIALNAADRALLSPITNRLFGLGFTLDGSILVAEISGDNFQRLFWKLSLSALVHCAVYFAGTEYILRRRLNLE